MFITFEGTEGTGKSTQCGLLLEYLRKEKKLPVLLTRDPGGTEAGEAIRQILLNVKSNLSVETEALLYMVSRAELARQVIAPALKSGTLVICDRWLDATVAYQGYGGGADVRWIEKTSRYLLGDLKPDLTLFLDLPVGRGLERIRSRGGRDRIERRPRSYHDRVRQGYLARMKGNARMRRIPVTTIQDTAHRVREAVCEFIP